MRIRPRPRPHENGCLVKTARAFVEQVGAGSESAARLRCMAQTDEAGPTSRVAVHSLLRATQRRLELLYALDPAPDVADFTVFDPANGPEQVFVRETIDALELQVSLPANIDAHAGPQSDDHVSVVEGVSHFLHLAERSRTRLSTSHLELELQAEVDKFILLWDQVPNPHPSILSELHDWLFGRVTYLDPAETVSGERYRLANRLAARLCASLLARSHGKATGAEALPFLRRFYRCGLAEKIHLAQAA